LQRGRPNKSADCFLNASIIHSSGGWTTRLEFGRM
jgi:hypothetical protein